MQCVPAMVSMEKITFGDNIPGYIYGPEDAPGVVMLQVSCSVMHAS